MASELGKVYVSPSHLTGKFQVMPLKPDGTVNLNVYAQARTLSFNTFEDAVKYAKGLVAHYGGTVESDTRGKSVNSRPGAKDMMAVEEGQVDVDGVKYRVLPYQLEYFKTDLAKFDDPNWRKQVVQQYLAKNYIKRFSRPGAKARFKVEDRFYFGKGRKERFAEIDVVNQLMQLAMKEGMADRMRPEIDRVLGSGSFDKLFKSYKSALISKRIMELKRQGKSTPEAFDLVLGAGAYKNMVGELYDALRAKASSKHSRPGKPERFADDAKQIADTILKQLGGGRFIAMTGAKNLAFMSNPPGLHMSLGRGTKDGIKYLRVNYDRGSDTYTMIFANKSGGTVKSVSHVYANSLQRVFTSTTGFDTHL